MKKVFVLFLMFTIFTSVLADAFKMPTPKIFSSLGKDVNQVIYVEPLVLGSFQARLTYWEKQKDQWAVGVFPIKAVIGRNGLAPLGEKKEGDGRTPQGIFKLGTVFGYQENFPEIKMDYRQATENDLWVDDSDSSQYNQWVVAPTDAKSFERLRRDDVLYKYGIVIEYNTDPVVPGAGSAIFFHIWRAVDQPTSGCVAISEENILQVFKWLDKIKNPVIILANVSTNVDEFLLKK